MKAGTGSTVSVGIPSFNPSVMESFSITNSRVLLMGSPRIVDPLDLTTWKVCSSDVS